MVDEFCLKMPDFHVTFWDLLHAVNLRHETSGFTSPPKEGVLRIFIDMKNPKASVGFEPANLGTKGQDATSRAPKPLLSTVSVHYCHQSNGFYSLPFLYAWGKPSINNIYRSAAIWWRYVVLYARYFPQNLVSMALRVGVHEFPPKKRHRSHHHVPGARRVTWSVFHTADRHFQTAQRFLLSAGHMWTDTYDQKVALIMLENIRRHLAKSSPPSYQAPRICAQLPFDIIYIYIYIMSSLV